MALQKNQVLDVSFENTEAAFQSKSDRELKKAYWLFKLIGNPMLVNVGKHLTNIALTLRLPVKYLIKKTIFEQFVGGETIDEVSKNIDKIKDSNIGAILDYSVEGKDDESSFIETMKNLHETIVISGKYKSVPFCVFKISGLASNDLLEKMSRINTPITPSDFARQASGNFELTADENRRANDLKKRVRELCDAACAMNTPILIDAEESWIQDTIDELTEEMMARCNKNKAIVYQTVQMYRHDRLAYLKKIHQDAVAEDYHIGVKIVRGAYMEKERERAKEIGYKDPIQPNKEASDRDFNEALKYCVNNLKNISIVAGSHNEESNMLLVNLMREKGIKNNDDRVYFAQLLGMSDAISYNLANANYNVAKYVPFGPIRDVMPYLIRRAQENTSAAQQTGRELSLIIKELKRRKNNDL